MNLKRGFMRLWTVFAVLLFLGVVAIAFSHLLSEFKAAHDRPDTDGWETMLPVDCSVARGTQGADYLVLTDTSTSKQFCWYRIANLRRLYPEYGGKTDLALAKATYSKAGMSFEDNPKVNPWRETFHPWRDTFMVFGFAIGVPVVVLLIGMGLWWAISGFRQSSTAEL